MCRAERDSVCRRSRGTTLDMDDLDLPEGALYAGRAGAFHTWKAKPETSADEKTAKFILYSGREVRFNPAWQEGGDVIRTREFKLANYRSCPIVLADHNPDRVIGQGTASIVDAGDDGFQLHGSVIWDISADNPLAVLIAGQHARGVRHACSIGFMPGKGSGPRTKLEKEDPLYLDPEKVSAWRAGWVHRYPELYEWSSVSVPKDPGALQLQAWAAEAETDEQRIQRLVNEILTRQSASLVLSAFRASQELRTAIVAATLAELPANATANANPSPAQSDWFQEWE